MTFPHETRQALSACPDPRVAYIVGQSRSTRRRTRTFEVHLQRISNRDVGMGVVARRTLEPRIVLADRDVQFNVELYMKDENARWVDRYLRACSYWALDGLTLLRRRERIVLRDCERVSPAL